MYLYVLVVLWNGLVKNAIIGILFVPQPADETTECDDMMLHQRIASYR